jgi:hypothetical protein
MDRSKRWLTNLTVLLALAGAPACGGSGSSGNDGNDPQATATAPAPTPTPTVRPTEPSPAPTTAASTPPGTPSTPTPTETPPTPTPTASGAARVSGLLVVRRDVDARAADALSPLAESEQKLFGPDFDRALSHADWELAGEEIRGETDADGRFAITDLPAGRYTMLVTKTVAGNLMSLAFPIVVGDDGALVLAEVAWGLVRSTSTYDGGGVEVVETFAPNGTRALWRDGRLTELSDGFRTFTDADGDGRFANDGCSLFPNLSLCEPDRGCSPGSACTCVSSCPFCEDCRATVCAPPVVCTDDRPCAPAPYSCGEDGGCAEPGHRCVCVPSCPECDDCALSACVPEPGDCTPAAIESIETTVPAELIVGQQGSAFAFARFSDGSSVDVTWLAAWSSSNQDAATIDAWGTIVAHAVGATSIGAAFAGVSSAARSLSVVERPTLLRIHVQNVDCYYPLGLPPGADGTARPAPAADAFLPPPICGQVVRIGSTLHFRAFGEFANGYSEDITDEVEWRVAPAEVATVDGGVFTALAEGTARLSAALGSVSSEESEIRVVAEATVLFLSIYPRNWGYPFLDGGPVRPAADAPCFECGYFFTALTGDEIPFGATAHYDTGEWEDVSARVAWRSSDAAVASIDAGGLMTALGAGETEIDAELEGVRSTPVGVRVVDEATLQSLYGYPEGTERVVAKGNQLFFHASGYYDVGFERDVTQTATWRSSNETVARFDAPGVLRGVGAGVTQVWAELDGQQSAPIEIEGYETGELDYCDATNVNRGLWSDDFNRVVLESDCDRYTAPGVVAIRYTVTETQPHGGIFDPCLDLYVLRGERPQPDTAVGCPGPDCVRVLREQGCGDPFLAAGAPERDDAVPKFQLRAFWDLKDEQGRTVAPGTYTILGRFYLYYDPIVSIAVEVLGE